MMQSLARQRCFNHFDREAAALCLHCKHYFCRECIGEHNDRSICASCLEALAKPKAARRRRLAGLLPAAQCLVGLLVAWFFFYLVGDFLASIPTSFHEGSLWRARWFDQ